MSQCSIPDCKKTAVKRGWCAMHYARWQRYGRLENIRRPTGSGSINKSGHVMQRVNGAMVYEHILVAERALGRQLPVGAQVHHVDLNPSNNSPSNLVICPSDAYHKLIHKRLRALLACGDPGARKCYICKKWNGADLRVRGKVSFHSACIQKQDRDRYAKRKRHASL